jgi:Sulfotransferase family
MPTAPQDADPDQGGPTSTTQPRTAAEWRAAAEAAGLDPTPTPLTWRTLPKVLERTWRTERINHATMARSRTFTPGSILACVRPSLRQPIFLIGAARSGTTFLGDAIGRIPDVSYHHEPVATKLAGRYVYDGSWDDRTARRFFRTVYAWLLRYQLDGGRRFAEKTPTNAFLVPFLQRTFPDAQFIHLIRDGRDVSASHIAKPWLRADSALSGKREPGGYLYGPWAPWWVAPDERTAFETGPDELRMSMAWRRYTEAALAGGQGLGPDRYREVRYEALMADPAAEGIRLLDFLHIDDAPSRQAFLAEMGRADPRSVGAWRRAFTPEQLAIIEADSGSLLRTLGYTD